MYKVRTSSIIDSKEELVRITENPLETKIMLNILGTVVGFIIFIFFGFRAFNDYGYKYTPSFPVIFGEFKKEEDKETHSNKIYNVSSHGQIGGITAGEVNITTTKFSQTQSIKVLPPSLGGNDSLNLDNIATLKLHVPYSMDSITMLLDMVVTNLPDQHSDNFSVEGTQYYNQKSGTEYTFNTTNNKRYEILVSGRVFIVTLLKINKLNIPNVPAAVEYQFGISEK